MSTFSRKFKSGDTVVLYAKKPEYSFHESANPYYPMAKKAPLKGVPQPVTGKVQRVVGDSVYVKWPTDANSYAKDLILYSEWAKTFMKEKAAPKAKLEELNKLVLAEDKKQSILSVIKQHQNSDKIFNKWGLGDVMEYGKGMTMLFWGPPGTGKTWACHCIAKALGKELMVMENAKLQSSTPGQMERNVQMAFQEAKSKDALLLFDECDSLLMARSNVGMIIGSEINCLLTEVEKFEGILIMTTNRIEELDPALERRISLTVQFPNPNEKHREEIWKKMLPKKLPLAKDVDLKELSSFEHLTGGLIKNVVLNAARFAVNDDREEIAMEYFIKAIETVKSSKSAFDRPSQCPRTSGVMRSKSTDIL